jgi:predicted nuclease of predicted toxin-antitoxin system
VRPDDVVFFVDRSLGKHHVADALRKLGAIVEVHDDHFAIDAPDAEWIAEVSRRGWVVLTKDQRIRHRPLERAVVVASGARLLALTRGNLSGTEMATVFAQHLAKMRRVVHGTPAPFIASVSRSRVTVERLRR